MNIPIPQNDRWTQLNKGDYSGMIYSSRNIDLNFKEGSVRPSHHVLNTTKIGSVLSEDTVATTFAKFTSTVGAVSTDRIWTQFGSNMYQAASEDAAFIEDTTSSSPADLVKGETDIKTFGANMYVATRGKIYKRTTTAWSTLTTSVASNKKLLEVYADRLFFVNAAQTIRSMNVAETIETSGPNTLDLDVEENKGLEISCMRAVSNGIWIGTTSNKGGRAKMFFWDGETADTVEFGKKINASGVLSIVIKDDRPYIFDTKGVLSTYNGSFFQEVARVDIDNKQLKNFNEDDTNNRFVCPNGMIEVDGEILINFNARPDDSTDTLPIKTPSGILAYNEVNGLYHKHVLSGQTDSSTVADGGQLELVMAGALLPLEGDVTLSDKDKQSDFLAGYSYKDLSGDITFATGIHDKRGFRETLQKVGLITLPKIRSNEIQEQWQKFVTFIKPFTNTTDKIVVKYRVQEYIPVETSITWVNSTSFTSTDASWAAIKTGFDACGGYEVEGIWGDGSGYLSHITNIEESGGTYTVTIDETIDGVTTRTAKVRVDRWFKAGDFTDADNMLSHMEFLTDKPSSWIQYRVYMLGSDIELERLLSISKVNKNSTQ